MNRLIELVRESKIIHEGMFLHKQLFILQKLFTQGWIMDKMIKFIKDRIQLTPQQNHLILKNAFKILNDIFLWMVQLLMKIKVE